MTDLYHEHIEMIEKVAGTFFPNPADAEDAMQDAYIKLSGVTLTGVDNEGGLVRVIVSNLFRDLYNKDKRIKELDQQAAVFEDRHDDDPLSFLERHSIGGEIGRRIDDMPDDLALTAKLYYLEGRSYKQISDILDIPEGTVASRLSKARSYFQGENV